MSRTIINVNYHYGAYKLAFEKEFELTFVPFYGLWFDDSNDDVDNIIIFETNDNKTTTIMYENKTNDFSVDVRIIWKFPITTESLDNIVEQFTITDWKTTQYSDKIESIKSIMLSNYKQI